jgi:hypothetical protein
MLHLQVPHISNSALRLARTSPLSPTCTSRYPPCLLLPPPCRHRRHPIGLLQKHASRGLTLPCSSHQTNPTVSVFSRSPSGHGPSLTPPIPSILRAHIFLLIKDFIRVVTSLHFGAESSYWQYLNKWYGPVPIKLY